MYRVESLPISIPIGRQGENHAMKIEIDCSSFLAEWPQATITAMLRRSVAENPYILVTSIDSNGILTWEPTAHDTGIEGDGQIEIRAVENDVLAKSVTAIVCVERSLTPPEPDTPIDWVENIKSDIAQSVTSAANSASDAAKSAASAQESAAAAAGSAAAAQSSANAAAGSASAASKSATGAAGSADAASKSAGDAAQSASDADASAKAAAGSAADAAGALDNVNASADAAAKAARAAAESANDAADSKSNAAQAATDAAQAASAAAGSASQSAAARDAAQAAAAAASAAASDAAGSATAAAGSKDAAAQSASAAAASAEAAEKAAQDAAGIIDDDVIAKGSTWSSKQITDQNYAHFTVSGNPAVCEDVLEGYPLELSASWGPKQEGSGTPSPDNVRPIVGTNTINLRKSSKNLLNPADADDRKIPAYGLRMDIVGENTVRIKGTYNADAARQFRVMWFNTSLLCKRGLKIAGTVVNGTHLAYRLYGLTDKSDASIVMVTEGKDWTPGTMVDMTLKIGVYAPEAALTEYQPYKGQDLSLTLPRTIYGGKIDPATGEGQETWGYIASYAGETLPGEWISDRDEYAAGATPTMGAQVAYKLATPVPFTATGGQTALALAGTNVIITDADTLTVGGVKPLRKPIDDTRVGTDNVWSAKHTADTLLPMQKVTGNPAVIETLEGYPLELSASWGPKQEGSGTPSPDNVRPIKGRNNVKITRKNKTQEDSITLALPTTIYGGEVDVETGKGINATGYIELTGAGNWRLYTKGKTDAYILDVAANVAANPILAAVSSHLTWRQYAYAEAGSEGNFAFQSNGMIVYFCVTQTYKTVDGWKAYLAAQYAAGTPVQVAYKLATPESFTATGGGRIDALAGTNTISTDADTVTITAPTPPQTTASAAEAQAAKLDYVAMMADVDMDDLTAADDADADSGIDMPTDIEGSETDGKQEV